MLHMVQKLGGVPPSSFGKRAAVVATALGWVALLTLLLGGSALAQDPTPTPLLSPTDTRSDFL
ncbi:MAG TPA: hypothetical protein VH741_06325, partial [Candidatus Limnocylindrales bacterium]